MGILKYIATCDYCVNVILWVFLLVGPNRRNSEFAVCPGARSRPVNKGLRLDYFLCSARLFNKESEVARTDTCAF